MWRKLRALQEGIYSDSTELSTRPHTACGHETYNSGSWCHACIGARHYQYPGFEEYSCLDDDECFLCDEQIAESKRTLLDMAINNLLSQLAPLLNERYGYNEDIHNVIQIDLHQRFPLPPPRFLPKYVRKTISRSVQKRVFERDGYKCVKCGTHIDLSIDHIVAVANGGTNDFDNLQTMCLPHNCSKGAR